MATQQVIPVTCPNCNAQFTAPIDTIVDAQNVTLKSALLQGKLNIVQCPQCGFTSELSTPILYYDQEKELAFVLMPSGINITQTEQEKMIGDVTNQLVNSLPPEERKFYLFNPRQFLSLDSMRKAILEAEGITEEELESQRATTKLIEEFLKAPDEATLKKKVKENEAALNREFFEVLTASIQATYMDGHTQTAQALLALRSLTARFSQKARQAIAEIDKELGIAFIKSQEELLEKLQAAEDEEEFESLLTSGYTMLDYNFFQKLTGQIDQAEKENQVQKAQALRELRTKILDVKDRHEEQMQAAIKKSSQLLTKILQSDNPQQTLAQNLDRIDESFFMVLSANIEDAQKNNRADIAQHLETLGNLVLSMLEERAAKKAQVEQPPASGQIHIAS